MVDPDNLLIFKLREKGVSAPTQASAPTPTNAQAATAANKTAKATETIIQAKPAIAPAPAEKQQATTKAQQNQSETKTRESSVLGNVGHKDTEPKLKISDETYTISQYQPYTIRAEETTSFAQSEAFPDPGVYFTSDVQQTKYRSGYGKLRDIRNKAQSREIAAKLTCINHPWRHAYAVCFTCHRPFCFEDIVEYKKGYYCSNDMAKISNQYKARLASEYGLSNLVPALLIMSLMLGMIYYSSNTLAGIAAYIWQSGIVSFVISATNASKFILADVLILLINMLTATYAISQSRNSSITNIIVTIIAVVFMSYQFFTYQFGAQFESLIALISMVEFLAFTISVHAIATRVMIDEKSSYSNDMYDFTYSGMATTTPGRF
jgi:hypothetical protein